MRTICLVTSVLIFAIATSLLIANKHIKENKIKLTLTNAKSIVIQIIYFVIGIAGGN